MSIDYEVRCFLSAYRNKFKRWLTAYSICTLPIPHSGQICFIISSAEVRMCSNVNLWTAARWRNCTGAGVLISFISAGAGTCKQVSADSVVKLFHALLVMQRKSNEKRRIKVVLTSCSGHKGASYPPHCPSSQLCSSACAGQVWMNVRELFDCETGRGWWRTCGPWKIPPVSKMLKVGFKHHISLSK